jgi:hypothetical protein
METGNVAEVATYSCHGVVPCVTETVPLTGNVTDVETYTFQGVVYCDTLIGVLTTLTGKVALVTTYACTGCGNEVTETLPVIGIVAEVLT